MKLISSIVGVDLLKSEERDVMYSLMSKYYENVERNKFEEDLSEKKDVILIRDLENDIQGFSTLMFIETNVNNQKVNALFSGDTIIDKSCWGEFNLSCEWARYALEASKDKTPLYWFLISKGYKTYKYLPTFFNEFYPRYDKQTPTDMQAVLDAFSELKFPGKYNKESGIIYFGKDKDHLKRGVADIEERHLRNPHIAYFAKKNSRWYDGDELPCIIPITLDNFNEASRRVIDYKGCSKRDT